VKRIRPAVLGPFDYTQKVRSGAIWFCEGVTDYYSAVLMRLAGITSADDFLADMAGRISQLDTNPARLKISAEEASRKGWEGGSMGFGGLDYYNKGSVLGFLLDVEIRAATANARSLDDVMRLLDEEYGKKDRGYPEDGILKAINRVAGKDFSEFYNMYVKNPGEIAWNEILAKSGLVYEVETTHKPFIGFSSTAGKEDALTILLVLPGSPAAAVSLKEGDVVTTLDGTAVKHTGWQDTVAKLAPDQQVKLGVRRGDKDLQVALTVGHRDNTTRRLTRLPSPNAVTARVLDGVLRSNAAVKTSMGVWKYGSGSVSWRILPSCQTSILPNLLPSA
jgi:predicted metalloprotease with PDZ domain